MKKTNKPLNVKVTNLMTSYANSNRLDNSFLVELSIEGVTSMVDVFDLENVEYDAIAANDYDGTDEVCKKLLERDLLEQKGPDLYFTGDAKKAVKKTFLSHNFAKTCEEADGYDIGLDILSLLEYGVISFPADEKTLPLILFNIQAFNALVLRANPILNISFTTERYMDGEDEDEKVLISAADDIWMTRKEAEELGIPTF